MFGPQLVFWPIFLPWLLWLPILGLFVFRKTTPPPQNQSGPSPVIIEHWASFYIGPESQWGRAGGIRVPSCPHPPLDPLITRVTNLGPPKKMYMAPEVEGPGVPGGQLMIWQRGKPQSSRQGHLLDLLSELGRLELQRLDLPFDAAGLLGRGQHFVQVLEHREDVVEQVERQLGPLDSSLGTRGRCKLGRGSKYTVC